MVPDNSRIVDFNEIYILYCIPVLMQYEPIFMWMLEFRWTETHQN
jgi:hypothetical protein